MANVLRENVADRSGHDLTVHLRQQNPKIFVRLYNSSLTRSIASSYVMSNIPKVLWVVHTAHPLNIHGALIQLSIKTILGFCVVLYVHFCWNDPHTRPIIIIIFFFFLEKQEHLIQTKVLCSICDNHPLFQLHYGAGSSMQQIIHWMIEKSADTMYNIWSIKISKIGNLFTNKQCQVCFCLTDSTEVLFDKPKDKDQRRQDKAAFRWGTD